MPESKSVLMILDGLATTHDPVGHNLPRGTPAVCFLYYDTHHGIPDPYVTADRAGIRNSVMRRGKTLDAGNAASIVTSC